MLTDLHEVLQRFYAGESGETEVEIGDYRADAIRDGVIYEIQTASFAAIRDKLHALARQRPVVLVHPLPRFKYIVKLDPETGEELSCRRSPKRWRLVEVFEELVHAPGLLARGNLSVELVVTVERELRCDDGAGSWRRGGVSIVGRELMAILEVHRFDRARDLLALLPEGLPEEFTVAELAEIGEIRRRLAGRMAYALREAGAIEHIGNRGNAYLYRRAED
ncbi:MAG: hypothetical protein U9R79_17840 [Armatimonadota bacterium]|nr:hypothetical protein [Armatimonadota bacterium]